MLNEDILEGFLLPETYDQIAMGIFKISSKRGHRKIIPLRCPWQPLLANEQSYCTASATTTVGMEIPSG